MNYYKIFFLRALIIPFALILFGCSNSIENIKTDDDVTNFITKDVLENQEVFVVADSNILSGKNRLLKSLRLIADTLKMSYWYKADFDGDNNLDLLAYGSSSLYFGSGPRLVAVITNGGTNYKFLILTPKRLGGIFPKVVESQIGVLLVIYITLSEYKEGLLSYKLSYTEDQINNALYSGSPLICVDTLIYKFGGFVEFNHSPVSKEVSKINFTHRNELMDLELLNLTLNANSESSLTIKYKNRDSISYSGQIKKYKLTEIYSIINYMNFDMIDTSYVTNSFYVKDRASSFYIDIVYDNYKHLKTSDVGLSGPYILRLLIEKLMELNNSEFWDLVNE
jgi:hypothetical protein